jgi:hypothetical protein
VRGDELGSGGFGLEHGGQAIAAVLADDHHHLALAALVLGQAAIHAVFGLVRRHHVSAEVGPINGRFRAFAAQDAALQLGGHRLADFVHQNPGGPVGDAQVARGRQRALALHLVHRNGDGGEVHPQRQLVGSEQRPRGDAEILLAGAATEPGRTVRAAAIVGVQTAAQRAHGLAVRLRPTNVAKSFLSLRIGHAKHRRQRESAGAAGLREVLAGAFHHQIRYVAIGRDDLTYHCRWVSYRI